MDELSNINKEDVAYSIVKGLSGMVPVLGSLAAELFGLVITPPLEQRRTIWMNDVAVRLKALEDKRIINIGELQHNDLFIDVVVEATTYAVRTSVQAKKDAFRNAVVNTAKGMVIDSTISHILLKQLDAFTELHIRLLSLFSHPVLWFHANSIPFSTHISVTFRQILIQAYPDLANQHELVLVVWKDLISSGFFVDSSLDGQTQIMDAEVISGLGRQFLLFINEQP